MRTSSQPHRRDNASRNACEHLPRACKANESPRSLLPTIPQLAALLQRCVLQVGGDSGVTHLAPAVGTRTFSFLRDYPAIKDWMLTGDAHRQIVVPCDCINRKENVCEALGKSKCLGASLSRTCFRNDSRPNRAVKQRSAFARKFPVCAPFQRTHRQRG